MIDIAESLAHHITDTTGHPAYGCYNPVRKEYFIQICHKDKPGIHAIQYINEAILDNDSWNGDNPLQFLHKPENTSPQWPKP